MSDTPETDASCGYALSSHYGRLDGSYLQMDWSGPFVHAEVARKLERERDEAREKAERYRLEANSLMLQRDEARESLKHIGEYGTEEINAAIDLRQKLASALVERDEAIRQRNETNESSVFSCNFYYEEKLKAERERNEIQEKYDALATEHMLVINKLCEERDEAREQINRYRYNLDLLPIKWDI